LNFDSESWLKFNVNIFEANIFIFSCRVQFSLSNCFLLLCARKSHEFKTSGKFFSSIHLFWHRRMQESLISTYDNLWLNCCRHLSHLHFLTWRQNNDNQCLGRLFGGNPHSELSTSDLFPTKIAQLSSFLYLFCQAFDAETSCWNVLIAFEYDYTHPILNGGWLTFLNTVYWFHFD